MAYTHYPMKQENNFAIRKNSDTVAYVEEKTIRHANVKYLDWDKTTKYDIERYLKDVLGYKKVTFFVNESKFLNLFEKIVIESKEEREDKDDNEALYQFLLDNPSPSDEEFHKFAEEQSKDKHKAEEEVYKLASKFVRFIKGGEWNKEGPVPYDENELKMGIEVEYEHTPDKDVARKIALDHLTELKDYYTRLAKMEEGEQENN